MPAVPAIVRKYFFYIDLSPNRKIPTVSNRTGISRIDRTAYGGCSVKRLLLRQNQSLYGPFRIRILSTYHIKVKAFPIQMLLLEKVAQNSDANPKENEKFSHKEKKKKEAGLII